MEWGENSEGTKLVLSVWFSRVFTRACIVHVVVEKKRKKEEEVEKIKGKQGKEGSSLSQDCECSWLGSWLSWTLDCEPMCTERHSQISLEQWSKREGRKGRISLKCGVRLCVIVAAGISTYASFSYLYQQWHLLTEITVEGFSICNKIQWKILKKAKYIRIDKVIFPNVIWSLLGWISPN